MHPGRISPNMNILILVVPGLKDHILQTMSHSLLPWDLACAHFRCAHLPLIGPTITLNLLSWKAVGLRTGAVLELGLRSLNVSVACQLYALFIAL